MWLCLTKTTASTVFPPPAALPHPHAQHFAPERLQSILIAAPRISEVSAPRVWRNLRGIKTEYKRWLRPVISSLTTAPIASANPSRRLEDRQCACSCTFSYHSNHSTLPFEMEPRGRRCNEFSKPLSRSGWISGARISTGRRRGRRGLERHDAGCRRCHRRSCPPRRSRDKRTANAMKIIDSRIRKLENRRLAQEYRSRPLAELDIDIVPLSSPSPYRRPC
jgi:hypothetical protein